jgi:hypothetical protein
MSAQQHSIKKEFMVQFAVRVAPPADEASGPAPPQSSAFEIDTRRLRVPAP